MPKSDKPSGGVVAIRSRNAIFLAPGIMGWSNLIDPDDAFDSLKFTLAVHYNPDQVELLGNQVGAAMKSVWDEFLDAAAKAKKATDKYELPDGREWVEEHLKEPGEKSRIRLPSIKFANDAEFRDGKTGKMVRKTMRAYSPSGDMLDLEKLQLGRGSIVQPLVVPGIFVSPIVRNPTPSFKLQGLRVLKLEQFGGQGRSVGEVSQDEIAGLGEDFKVDDLAGFAAGMTGGDKVESRGTTQRRPPQVDVEEDLDAEIPF